jgi:hypothetical protein
MSVKEKEAIRDFGKEVYNEGNRLPSNVYEYEKLKVHELLQQTSKAVQLYVKIEGHLSGVKLWFPLSQLVADRNFNIWCPEWLVAKKLEEIQKT